MGAVGVILALLLLRERPSEGRTHFDLPGFVLAATGLAAVLYALSKASISGWLCLVNRCDDFLSCLEMDQPVYCHLMQIAAFAGQDASRKTRWCSTVDVTQGTW